MESAVQTASPTMQPARWRPRMMSNPNAKIHPPQLITDGKGYPSQAAMGPLSSKTVPTAALATTPMPRTRPST